MLKLERVISVVARRCRSRAAVELENVALRHQLHVLRRQRPGRLRLFIFDRWLWVWLYRLWPRCLDTMMLAKPATVIQWHRQGFRLYWRWRSRSGRPSVDREQHSDLVGCGQKRISVGIRWIQFNGFLDSPARLRVVVLAEAIPIL